MGREQEYIWITVHGPLNKTDKAVFYETDEGDLWIPRSQIGAHKEENGHHTRLEITKWIADQKGLCE